MKKVWFALGKAVCYTLAFLLMQMAGAFIANVVFCAVRGASYFAQTGSLPYDELMAEAVAFTERNAVVITAGGDLLAVLAVGLFFRLRGKRLAAETRWVRPLRGRIGPALLCGVCLSTFVALALVLLPIPAGVMQSYVESSQGALAVRGPLSLLCITVVGPVCEEVFFRGLVYTRLRRAMHPVLAGLIQCALFGVIHGDLLWIIYAFCMAAAMTFIYEKCGTLRASIGFHIAFNLFGVNWGAVLEQSGYGVLVAMLLLSALGAGVLLRRIARFKNPVLDKPPEEALY